MITDKLNLTLLHDERIQRARHKILFNLPFWIAAGLTALISVFYNKLFAICEEFALSHKDDNLLLWTAPLALLASFLIGHFISKEAIGSGIPQVIVATELAEKKHSYLDKLLSIPMLIAKILGSCV